MAAEVILVCPSCRRGTLKRHCALPAPGAKSASHTCDLVRCTMCAGFGLPPGPDGVSKRWVDPGKQAA